MSDSNMLCWSCVESVGGQWFDGESIACDKCEAPGTATYFTDGTWALVQEPDPQPMRAPEFTPEMRARFEYLCGPEVCNVTIEHADIGKAALAHIDRLEAANNILSAAGGAMAARAEKAEAELAQAYRDRAAAEQKARESPLLPGPRRRLAGAVGFSAAVAERLCDQGRRVHPGQSRGRTRGLARVVAG